MKFELVRPCKKCPFRTDCLEGWLGKKRAKEIIGGFKADQTFTCHETNEFDDETGEAKISPNQQHCAGALILLEKHNRPNQMMRIAERLGFYDRTKLDYKAPVFNNYKEFIDHHT